MILSCYHHCRKTCPTNRGLRHHKYLRLTKNARRKTCPTNRGLRHHTAPHKHGYTSRKTCPTNRGLRRCIPRFQVNAIMSEDLPHKSGIKTLFYKNTPPKVTCRKTCPTNRGLRLINVDFNRLTVCRKTCPTNRGLRR